MIIDNQEIAKGIYKMRLKYEHPKPEPGQFVNIYLNDESRLLPRPISVCDWNEGVLTIVYAVVGAGTKILSTYKPRIDVRVSVPLGKGFSPEGGKKILLVGGGVGVPPLLYLAKSLKDVSTRAVLGFRSEPFLADEFPCTVETATDDGSYGFHGNVIELLKKTGVEPSTKIFSCGPKPMLKAITEFAIEHGLEVEISLEERMGCGYGACVGCTCKTTNGNRKVCEDGPVFNGKEVLWNE